MAFDPNSDEIAVAIPHFRMRKSADGIKSISQPYIITLAIDEHGVSNPLSALTFNTHRFPNVKKWSSVIFGGQGRLIYGPANPGRFVCYSVLFMDDDQKIRDNGEIIQEILSSEETKALLLTLGGINPTVKIISGALSSIMTIISQAMQKNKDDELIRVEGTLLRNVNPPYNIGDTFNSSPNEYIEFPVKVIPLINNNSFSDLAMFSEMPVRLELS